MSIKIIMRQKAIVIIGDPDYGKTTIIRCLTGIEAEDTSDFVEDKRSRKCIYVEGGSPQETEKTLADIEVIVGRILKRSGCEGLVISFQTRKTRKWAGLEETIESLLQKFQVHLFLVEYGYKGQKLDVKQVKQRIKNIKGIASIKKLDGRRYGIFNALFIRQVTNILAL
jgi:energy-coupling factor transporter ATP-binding protein EcfA2